MAKKAGKSESSYSYFKDLFHQHPEWLKEKSNSVIVARYKADHNLPEGTVIEKKVMNNLANLKSVMRKNLRTRLAAKNPGVPVAKSSNRLEVLEEQIDDCLTLAKNLDRAGLDDVIHLLRRARNKVVWRLGEK
jgi:hypothetical protein